LQKLDAATVFLRRDALLLLSLSLVIGIELDRDADRSGDHAAAGALNLESAFPVQSPVATVKRETNGLTPRAA
jgi:hypothetical protein